MTSSAPASVPASGFRLRGSKSNLLERIFSRPRGHDQALTLQGDNVLDRVPACGFL
jgi:hypothetical protein